MPSNDRPDERWDRRLARGLPGIFKRFLEAFWRFARRPLILAIVFAVFVANADKIFRVGGVERWVLVAGVAALACSIFLVLWRSRTRRRLLNLERQMRLAEELGRVSSEQALLLGAQRDADSQDLAIAARDRTYANLQRDVGNGLTKVLESPDSIDVVRYVERNCLRAINETLAGELGGESTIVRIETGIAIRTDDGLRVTHASGPITQELKDEGGCLSGETPIEDLLARKAAAHFRREGWYVAPLADTVPQQYLFMLSTELLGPAEHYALKQLAWLCKLATVALVRVVP